MFELHLWAIALFEFARAIDIEFEALELAIA